ncbi:MAG: Unknown protein [uncultured Sulfurovum sp.]|uniref:DUF4384 domain-containing protein n=1 Tax=uncultured Sulfurovum sp. TaxID=269237 RepID=A0A6S6SAZ7_9BACT|nr:MAG: Unknown protein [uncultured Sulfurovum sp.]
MSITKRYKVSLLVLSSIIITGCVPGKKEAPVPTPVKTEVQSSEKTIAALKYAQFGSIQLKGKTEYSQNQSIQFIVDTKGKTGYLYIVYADNKGNTALLYPNAQSPLTELNGKYIFPRDFGGMNINATKDCKGCQQEKTTVYAILSKEQISDINNLKLTDLTNSTQSKGLSMNLRPSGVARSDINIGKIEFFVK